MAGAMSGPPPSQENTMKSLVMLVVGGVAALALATAGLGLGRGPEDETKMKTLENRQAGKAYSKSGYDIAPLSKARVEELAKKLSPADADIILAKVTEPAFCGTLLDNHKDGVYVCKL